MIEFSGLVLELELVLEWEHSMERITTSFCLARVCVCVCLGGKHVCVSDVLYGCVWGRSCSVCVCVCVCVCVWLAHVLITPISHCSALSHCASQRYASLWTTNKTTAHTSPDCQTQHWNKVIASLRNDFTHKHKEDLSVNWTGASSNI